MRKRLLSILLAVCMMLTMAPAASAVDANTATKEVETLSISPDVAWFDINNKKDSYTITTAAELLGLYQILQDENFEYFCNFSSITIKLGNNIILNGVTDENWTENAVEWKSMSGNSATNIFAGTFDGDGHSIIGLYSTDGGLFANVNDATIQNLTIDSAVINTDIYNPVGAVIGSAGRSKITNCKVTNSTIITHQSVVGGIAGSSNQATIENCQTINTKISGVSAVGGISGDGGAIANCTVDNDCTVLGGKEVGGIAGSIAESITNCTNSATVSGTGCLGGIAGASGYGSLVLIECINNGSVTVSNADYVGGILGSSTSNDLTISKCVNNAPIEGKMDVAGIAGLIRSGSTVSDCESNGSVKGTKNVAGIVGVSSLNKASYEADKSNSITGCIVSAEISGSEGVGGLVGLNTVDGDESKGNTKIQKNILTPSSSVKGTTSIGALIGRNNETTDTGKVKNNFWPKATVAVSGTGAGSSDADAGSTIMTTNSAYNEDGGLITTITTDGSEQAIAKLSEAINKIISSGSVPDVLKATATFNNGGHGTAPAAQTVVIGTEIALPTMSNDGYWTFLNWTANGATYATGSKCTIMKDVTFTANWRNDKPSVTVAADNLVYDKTEKKPAVTVKVGSETLSADKDYTVEYEDNINAGNTAKVTVTAKNGGTYQFDAVTTTFTISKAAATIKIDNKTMTKGGTLPTFTCTVEGLIDGDKLTTNPTLTCTAKGDTTGTFDITGSGADAQGNYTFSYENGTLTVNSRSSGSSSDKSSSSSTTKTETKSDGSTTTTTTKSDGTKVETTKSTDGSTTVVESKTTTDSKGNTTETKSETTTAKDGSKTETKTETVTAKDGSKVETEVKTETKTDGTKTESETKVETKTDGSKVETAVKTETKTDGSKSETTSEVKTAADGTTTSTETTKATDAAGSTGTTTTETNAAGETTVKAEAKVSEKAVEAAQKTNTAVTVPVEVKATTKTESAPVVNIAVSVKSDSSSSKAEVKVEVPVTNIGSGTVAVLVKADGTEEIVKTTVPTKGGVQIKVSGDVTIKVVDNSKNFADTADHWSKNEVNFVASREIFNGVGNNDFGVSEPMTRGMVNTVLARLSGENTEGGANWYDKGNEWAKANGVSDGANPTANVTREQLATMLYRYVGSPEVTGTLTFADAEDVNDYAQSAMLWAVQNGILNGVGDNRIAPNNSAERAQVAAMLARYIKLVG